MMSHILYYSQNYIEKKLLKFVSTIFCHNAEIHQNNNIEHTLQVLNCYKLLDHIIYLFNYKLDNLLMLGRTKFEFFKYDKFVILNNESMEIFTTFTKLTSELYLMTHFSL